jgi:O-antigen ligase
VNIKALIGILFLVELVLETGFLINTSWVEGFSVKNGLLYGLLLLSLQNIATSRRSLPKSGSQALVIFLILCVWTAMTCFWQASAGSGRGVSTFGGLVLVKGLVLDSFITFAVFSAGLSRRTDYLALSRWIVLVLGIFCLLAILEVRSAGETIYGALTLDSRNRGPFGEPNQTGAIIAMMIPIAVGWCVRTRGGWRAAFMASAAVMIATLLVTGSRGGMVATAVAGIPLLATLRREGRMSQQVLVVAAIAAAILVAWVVLPEASRLMATSRLSTFGDVTDDPTRASAGRLLLWGIAFSLWADRPLIGHGWGFFQAAVGSPTHNEFVMYLVDAGIIGFALYVGVWVCVLRLLRLARRSGGGDSLMLSAFHGSILGGMTAICFVNLYRPVLFLWAIVGMVVAYCGQVVLAARVVRSTNRRGREESWTSPVTARPSAAPSARPGLPLAP